MSLVSNPASVVYSGTGVVQLKALPAPSLNALITVTDYGTFATDSLSYVKQSIQANVNELLDWAAITISAPQLNTDSTASPRNSKVVLTAVTGRGYTGSVTLYFDRVIYTGRDFPDMFVYPQASAWTGTPYQWLTQFQPWIAVDYDASQLNPTPFTVPAYASHYVVPAAAPDNSWTQAGGENIYVNRDTANWYGDNTLSAYDAGRYNDTAFTDYLGNTMVKSASFQKGVVDGPFSGSISTTSEGKLGAAAGTIPPSRLAAAWTLDTWVYNDSDLPSPYTATLYPLSCRASYASFDAANRLHIGPHDVTYGYYSLWNNNGPTRALSNVPATPLFKRGWVHLALTYNGAGTLTGYVNGKKIFTITGWSIQAGSGWITGLQIVAQSTTKPAGFERWRLRTGVQFSADFDARQIYPVPVPSTKTDISTLVTNRSLGTLASDALGTTVIQKAAAANGIILRSSELTTTAPVTVTSPLGNTKVTISAATVSRYSGSVDVFYNR